MTVVCIEQIFDSRFLLRENRTDRVHDQVLFNLNSLMKKLYLMEPKPNVELHTFKGILLMHSYNIDIFFLATSIICSLSILKCGCIDRSYHDQRCFSFVLSTMKVNLLQKLILLINKNSSLTERRT